MNAVEWSRRAEFDLEEIALFIGVERRNPKAADRLLDDLRDKADACARQPGMGTLHPEIDVPGLLGPVRSFRVKSYVGFYHETAAGILVLRVVHGMRDYASLF